MSNEPTGYRDESQATDLVPSQHGQQQIAPINPILTMLFGQGQLPELSNFDGDNMRKWQLGALCKGGEAIKGKKAIDVPIQVKYIFLQKVNVKGDQPGEILDVVRTCFVTPDNQVYAYTGDLVAAEAAGMIVNFGYSPFDPPMVIKVVDIETRMGRRANVIQPVI